MPKVSFLPSLLLLLVGFSSTAFSQALLRHGKITKEFREPATAHVVNSWDAGKVRRIRGRLYCCEEGIPPESIVCLYRIVNDKELFLYSYLVGESGEFNFRGLAKGIYLLKTGTLSRGFNSNDVRVTLAPQDKNSSSEDIEISIDVGT